MDIRHARGTGDSVWSRSLSGEVSTSLVQRSVAWAVLALALAHSAIIALWILPWNPIRAAVGDERVANYVSPLFAQNWSVFAPSPGVAHYNLLIRAYVGEPGKDGDATQWVDVSRRAEKRLFPKLADSRGHVIGRRLAEDLTVALNEMSAEQRDLTMGNYYDTPVAVLGGRLEAEAPGYSAAKYILRETRTTTFATLVARALWGKEVTLVQFKIAVHNIQPYSDRRTASEGAEPDFEDLVGWRAAVEVPAHAQQLFDDFVGRGF